MSSENDGCEHIANLPDGAVVSGHVVVFSYLDPNVPEDETMNRYTVWFSGDISLSSALGLLELAKHDLIQRCG